MRWDYVLGKFFNTLNTHCICLRESLSLKENWHAIDVSGLFVFLARELNP